MTNIMYTISSQTSTGIVLNIPNIDDNKGVWVTYDVFGSTGVLPGTCRYYTWHCKTSSGYITLNNTTLLNNGAPIDYLAIPQYALNILSFFEYYVLQQLLQKIDLVSRRYPATFPKTFAISELMLFIEASILDINLYPPMTRFWFTFSDYDQELDLKTNPYRLQTGIPFEWGSLAVDGAMLQALTALGLLEANINFGYSDQGIQVTYNIADPINRWYDNIIKTWDAGRLNMKRNYYGFQATGTVPFSIGFPGTVNTLLSGTGLGAGGGYPWWRQSGARPM